MKLQGRNLSLRLRGKDVQLLHTELGLLGLVVPKNELDRATFGPVTEALVKAFQSKHTLKPTGIVEANTARLINQQVDALKPAPAPVPAPSPSPMPAPEPAPAHDVRGASSSFLVQGRVVDTAGHALQGLLVRAFDKGLRTEEQLGERRTDARGNYAIRYAAESIKRARRKTAYLIVRVMGKDDQVLASSAVVFNAQPIETVDLTVDGTQGLVSEWEALVAALTPLLDKVAPEDLTEEDIAFLAGEADIETLPLVFLSAAHQHSAHTGIAPEIFYGLFRQGLPTEITALLAQSPSAVRAALETAMREGTIPTQSGRETALKQLGALAGTQLIGNSDNPDIHRLGGLLASAKLTTGQQSTFLNAWLQHDGPVEEFWDSMRKHPQLKGRVDALQSTMQLGLIAQDNLALVKSLQSKAVASPRDLAKLTRLELQTLIDKSDEAVSMIAAGDADETREQRVARYADEVLGVAEEAFPTAFVQAGIQRKLGARHPVAQFLEQAPDLELRDASIDDYVSKNPQALASFDKPDEVKGELKRIQRVMRVAPRFDHMDVLLDAGLDSAHAMSTMSEAAFVSSFSERVGGAQQARSYFAKAKQVSTAVAVAFTSAKQSLFDLMPLVIGAPGPSSLALPNFSTLFGAYSLCECAHCRSVYSPAAYLVDLLQFINPKAGIKPLHTLRLRRPDIEHIALTCENTNTALPYIDLVNELLEFFIVHKKLATDAVHDTGGMSAEELSVNPEFTIEQAYTILGTAVYPPSLPFHRPLTMARLYLQHLGSPREEIMRAFQRNGAPSELEAASEALRISGTERDVLTGTDDRPVCEFYGYGANDNDWLAGLGKVTEFLRRTETNFKELLQLLASRFVNPGGIVHLSAGGTESACDLAKTTITPMNEGWLQKAHRFVRLARKLEWTFADLDQALTAFQATSISAEIVQNLAGMKQLEARLGMKRDVMLSLWATLGRKGLAPLYESLFLNKRVANPLDPDFELNNAKTELQSAQSGTPSSLSDKAPALLAALRLSADELTAIRVATGLDGDAVPLDLANLSALHRHAALARAMRVTVHDLLALRVLADLEPFVQGDPGPTLAFVDLVQAVRASGFSVAAINYVCRSIGDPARPLQPGDEAMDAFADQLRQGLLAIADEQRLVDDPNGDVLRARLGGVVPLAFADTPEGFVEQTLAVVNSKLGPGEPTAAEQGAFVAQHLAFFLDPAETTSVLQNAGNSALEKRNYILDKLLDHLRLALSRQFVIQALSDHFKVESRMVDLLVNRTLKAVGDPAQFAMLDCLALQTSEAPPDSAQLAFRQSYLRLLKVSLLLNGFRMSFKELEHLVTHVADFGGVDLNALPVEPSGVAAPFFIHWRRLAQWFGLRDQLPQGEADLVDVFASATRSEAVEKLKQASAWSVDEVDFMVGSHGFDLADADFKNEVALLRLQRCMKLNRRLGVTCAKLLAWAQTDCDATQAQEIVNAAKAKYDPEHWLATAKPLNDALREQRKAALVAFLLASDTMSKLKITNANQLYEYFLIDVEMGSCMQTSRIRQALSSVQLFIQRCLMNLEGNSLAAAIDEDRWEWMKNYRVWEANRKVFLYPENWIEPELRDNKTPFFRELETQLLQDDITADTAEAAFLSYLEKLDGVAKLEICGHCHQTESDSDESVDILHVVGRTKHTPAVYYYRQLASGIWTPWEKIDMEIQGDHLIPVVFNRRLYLFWPQFEEKPDPRKVLDRPYIQTLEHWQWIKDRQAWEAKHALWESEHNDWLAISNFNQAASQFNHQMKAQDSPIRIEAKDIGPAPEEPRLPDEPARSSPPALMRWEIRLAWTEYRHGKWSARQTSSAFIASPFVTRSLEQYAKESIGLDNEAQIDIFLNSDFGTRKTICEVYLPERETHFFRTQIDPATGDLVLEAYRRYRHANRVLDLKEDQYEGYDSLGRFQLVCGGKVAALSDLAKKGFDDLARPQGTDNSYMTLLHQSGPDKLTFTLNGTSSDILKTIPVHAGNFAIVTGHAAKFRMSPPTSTFFYQDRLKTYYAHYEWDELLSSLRRPELIKPSISFAADTPLVDKIRKKGGTFKAASRAFTGAATMTSASAAPAASARSSLGHVALLEDASTMPAWSSLMEIGKVSKVAQGVLENVVAIHAGPRTGLRFENHFHPHLCRFMKALYRNGVPGLLSLHTQKLNNDALSGNVFKALYSPTAKVHPTYPREDVDFADGAYSLYNWELFFHIPMRIALSLSGNQQFEDAQKWFHYVFNPTSSSGDPQPQRYWGALPFFKNSHPEKEQIQELLSVLDSKLTADKSLKSKVIRQIEEWRDNPFNPHLIARLRITAYQKNVVMKYIDNLVAWADQLFSRNTIESTNEATLLYVLAYSILGPRPQIIPSPHKIDARSYAQLQTIDAFSNAMVPFENAFPYQAGMVLHKKSSPSALTAKFSKGIKGIHGAPTVLSVAESPYFCTPKNEELLAYWDTVEDRLFKIRHCMNIEGMVQQLPLFDPPIDPALLVKAAAAGLDIGSVLSDLQAPLPHYRFSTNLQKALELCGDLKALSGALLSALEKKDAEALSTLRAGHETSLLKAVRDVKQRQIDEAHAALAGLQKTRIVTETRYAFYRDIVRISTNEQKSMEMAGKANVFNLIAQHVGTGAAAGHAVPDFHSGTSGAWGSPVTVASYGGSNVGSGIQAIAGNIAMIATHLTHVASMASIQGGYDRRWNDWKLQEKVADKELRQIDQQIAAQEIRIAVTQRELTAHDRQIENAVAIEEFLRSKYSNENLYNWMLTQVSRVYFQAYKLAYQLAKRAEKTFQFERALASSNFIQFGYWDNLKKGLLAGELLALDLKRMETAYLEQNTREYEIAKHVSLMVHDPMALVALRETGSCEVVLPEALFDMDFPGHYMRRIKSVSLTIPCVVGPYASVNATLTLRQSEMRVDPVAQAPYPRDPATDDARFRTCYAATRTIATSHAQNDSGVFELNFRDERYLPFEGAGVVSTWHLELPKDCNAFDFDTISDVILHVKYTARDGGTALRGVARSAMQDFVPPDGMKRLISVRHEFPSEWHRFIHPAGPGADRLTLALDLSQERFPFLLRNKAIQVTRLDLFLKPGDGIDSSAFASIPVAVGQRDVADPNQPIQAMGGADLSFMVKGAGWGNVLGCGVDGIAVDIPKAIVLEILKADLPTQMRPDKVADLVLVAEFSVTSPPA